MNKDSERYIPLERFKVAGKEALPLSKGESRHRSSVAESLRLEACRGSKSGDEDVPSVCKNEGFIKFGSIGLMVDVERRTVLDRPSGDGDRVVETAFGVSSSKTYFFLGCEFFGVSADMPVT